MGDFGPFYETSSVFTRPISVVMSSNCTVKYKLKRKPAWNWLQLQALHGVCLESLNNPNAINQ